MATSRIRRAFSLLMWIVICLFAAVIGAHLFLLVIVALIAHDVPTDGLILALFFLIWGVRGCLWAWIIVLTPGHTKRRGAAVLLAFLFPFALTALPIYVGVRLCCPDRVVRRMATIPSSKAQPRQRIPLAEATLVILAALAGSAGIAGACLWQHQAFKITALCGWVLVFIWLTLRCT